MPLDWKLLIVLAAAVAVASVAAVVGLIYGVRRGWRALDRRAEARIAREVAAAGIRPRAEEWQVWDDEAEAGMTDQQVQMLRQGYVLLPEDLLAEVNLVQQDPLTLVPLPRLESERGGIPTGQLYPLSATDRADIALDAEHKRRADGAGEI